MRRKFHRTWKEYNYYIEANGVEDAKKVAVLLTVMGSKSYGLLRNLLAPGKPHEKTYDELVETLKGH